MSVLFRRSVKSIYRSSVAVVSRGRPCPGRRLTFAFAWNWFTSLETTFLVNTFYCVSSDSNLLIIRYAMDSDKPRWRLISFFKSPLFFDVINFDLYMKFSCKYIVSCLTLNYGKLWYYRYKYLGIFFLPCALLNDLSSIHVYFI